MASEQAQLPNNLLDFFVRVIDIYDASNNKEVDLIYLDFQKSFDEVSLERLLVKVMAHGIQGSAAKGFAPKGLHQ